ncbi:hypothetical protein [Rossellomorea marisflavi]|uniref:hypothetical protein n=1 Tax=Rossellomorea marisflavi TaxID=189381 RepID=UPI0009A62309|nr:hypothetical protein [Rossellomorea marisflavi]
MEIPVIEELLRILMIAVMCNQLVMAFAIFVVKEYWVPRFERSMNEPPQTTFQRIENGLHYSFWATGYWIHKRVAGRKWIVQKSLFLLYMLVELIVFILVYQVFFLVWEIVFYV